MTKPTVDRIVDEAAWAVWLDYRSQIKKKLFPVSWPLARKKLASFGANQMAVVEQSIENGYQGLFELKDGYGSVQVSLDVKAPW